MRWMRRFMHWTCSSRPLVKKAMTSRDRRASTLLVQYERNASRDQLGTTGYHSRGSGMTSDRVSGASLLKRPKSVSLSTTQHMPLKVLWPSVSPYFDFQSSWPTSPPPALDSQPTTGTSLRAALGSQLTTQSGPHVSHITHMTGSDAYCGYAVWRISTSSVRVALPRNRRGGQVAAASRGAMGVRFLQYRAEWFPWSGTGWM